jgi:hypothetical protein
MMMKDIVGEMVIRIVTTERKARNARHESLIILIETESVIMTRRTHRAVIYLDEDEMSLHGSTTMRTILALKRLKETKMASENASGETNTVAGTAVIGIEVVVLRTALSGWTHQAVTRVRPMRKSSLIRWKNSNAGKSV